MTEGARRWGRRVETALAACSVAYVAARFLRQRDDLAAAHVPQVVWLAVPAFAVVHAACGVLLACAWRDLLRVQGHGPGLRWAISTYGVTQLAKYIPGNVFHFVSRQLSGAAGGLPHGVLARSSLHELLSLAAAGLVISLWALPLIDDRLAWLSTPQACAALAAAALAAARICAGTLIARVLGLHLLVLFAAALVFWWLLGLLVARLREVGIYDDALIVVTADPRRLVPPPGMWFRLRRRNLRSRTSRLVPLFIKRAGAAVQGVRGRCERGGNRYRSRLLAVENSARGCRGRPTVRMRLAPAFFAASEAKVLLLPTCRPGASRIRWRPPISTC